MFVCKCDSCGVTVNLEFRGMFLLGTVENGEVDIDTEHHVIAVNPPHGFLTRIHDGKMLAACSNQCARRVAIDNGLDAGVRAIE